MHWTKCTPKGTGPQTAGLRSHTTTVVGSKLYIIGGYDANDCYNDLMIFDTDVQYWYKPHTVDGPGPLRAHTATAVGKKIFVFGGGDGPHYFKDVWVFDTGTHTWNGCPNLYRGGQGPTARRSHSAECVDMKLYIFGGGDGKQALNDLHCLDIETMQWSKVATRGIAPPKRGYHKSVMIGKTMYIIGGSDGQDAFSDVHMLDTATHTWSKSRAIGVGLLASTAVQLGNYISVFGGHSPSEYVNTFRCLDIRTLQWHTPGQTGTRPSPRAYHTMSLYNHRLWTVGGYDTVQCYDDVHVMELGSFACQEYAY